MPANRFIPSFAFAWHPIDPRMQKFPGLYDLGVTGHDFAQANLNFNRATVPATGVSVVPALYGNSYANPYADPFPGAPVLFRDACCDHSLYDLPSVAWRGGFL